MFSLYSAIIQTGIVVIVMVGLIYLDNNASYIAHILNNIFGLPHPGPKDRVGACYCREHEGQNEWSFVEYIMGRKQK